MVDLAMNRMLSVALVQVGPALLLADAATASCFKLSSLHCTVRPRMKTALAIRGRHGVQDTTLHLSSSTHQAHEPFTFIYNLTTLTFCNATFLARNLFIYVSVPHAINIIQFNSILTINLLDIYTAPCVMFLRPELHITRGIAIVVLKVSPVLGLESPERIWAY